MGSAGSVGFELASIPSHVEHGRKMTQQLASGEVGPASKE